MTKEEKHMSGNREKMHTGELYLPGDDEIMEAQAYRFVLSDSF